MNDAKRLAEMMEPWKLRELADGLTQTAALVNDDAAVFGSGIPKAALNADVDMLACAAAVLREVAGRSETDTVIEVDLSDPTECIHFDYEQGFCRADMDDTGDYNRSCGEDSRKRGSTDDIFRSAADLVEAPEWCPARGRIIVQAKSKAEESQ